jgi:glycosyltransferase involved in cell wall biosynthesis
MISIIIPVYNVAGYLDKCLFSVINQTYCDLQIILVNDGSTDESGSICEKWAKTDKRISYYSRPKQGQGAARNFGVSKAKGEYLTFLDADDWWDDQFGELMQNEAEKYGADVIICDINYVKNEQAECSAIRLPADKPLCAKDDPDIINRTRTFLWGKLYRTDFYKGLGIRQVSHVFEDTAVVPLIIAKAKKICRVAKPLQYYLRDRKGSITNRHIDVHALIDSLEILREGFEKHGLFNHYYTALKKLAFSQVRFTIRYLNTGLKDNQERLEEAKDQLFAYMDKTYPDWVNIENKRFCVIGNDEQADIIRLLLFDDEQLTIISSMDNNILSEKYDYVFKDLPTGLSTSEKWDFADRLFYSLQ